jgi:mono/diheme cytochrome c family protein
MYRGIIQHRSFTTHYLTANIKERKLESPWDRGRIWRILPNTPNRPAVTQVDGTPSGRVKQLAHVSGWVRDAAQRLLVENGGNAAVPELTQMVMSPETSSLARLHALWTLDGLGSLTPEHARAALTDSNPQVRAAGIRLAPPDLIPHLTTQVTDPSDLVKAHLALKLSAHPTPSNDAALASLLASDGRSKLLQEAALSGMRGREATFARSVLATASAKQETTAASVVQALASLVARAGKAQPVAELLDLAAAQTSARLRLALVEGLKGESGTKSKKASPVKMIWLAEEPRALAQLRTSLPKGSPQKALVTVEARLAWPGKAGAPVPPKVVPLTEAQEKLFNTGRQVYSTLCAACHQPHGFGLDGLAPPLVDSEWVLGAPDVPARIILHGLAGPVEVAGRKWNLAMPPLPHLTDEQVAAVLTYIRREWDHTASAVETETIKRLRAEAKDRSAMWTAEELKP